ncbi:MAG: WS/DGAT domain-containing protein [Acidimicrobiia bacterium]|nr:WS/DGAT domain-containing protein [Acidimicrobiia bacterium]
MPARHQCSARWRTVAALAAQAAADAKLAKWVTLPFNVVVSNVPGPPVPLYLNGAKDSVSDCLIELADALNVDLRERR